MLSPLHVLQHFRHVVFWNHICRSTRTYKSDSETLIFTNRIHVFSGVLWYVKCAKNQDCWHLLGGSLHRRLNHGYQTPKAVWRAFLKSWCLPNTGRPKTPYQCGREVKVLKANFRLGKHLNTCGRGLHL